MQGSRRRRSKLTLAVYACLFSATLHFVANKIIIPFVHSFALEWASVHVVCAPVKKAMLGPSVTFALTQRYMCAMSI